MTSNKSVGAENIISHSMVSKQSSLNKDHSILFYAHSKKDISLSGWQTLSDHSEGVATLSAAFAASFASGKHGRILGEIHDIGKVRVSFQSYLRRCNGIEDAGADYGNHSHSGTGACWLWNQTKSLGSLAKALAYCVARKTYPAPCSRPSHEGRELKQKDRGAD